MASMLKVNVAVDFTPADARRLDAIVRQRPYGRTRAAFVREIVLRELDRLEAAAAATPEDCRNGNHAPLVGASPAARSGVAAPAAKRSPRK